jgi:hypothetical protein
VHGKSFEGVAKRDRTGARQMNVAEVARQYDHQAARDQAALGHLLALVEVQQAAEQGRQPGGFVFRPIRQHFHH